MEFISKIHLYSKRTHILITFTVHCRSLWIKAYAKCMNVNIFELSKDAFNPQNVVVPARASRGCKVPKLTDKNWPLGFNKAQVSIKLKHAIDKNQGCVCVCAAKALNLTSRSEPPIPMLHLPHTVPIITALTQLLPSDVVCGLEIKFWSGCPWCLRRTDAREMRLWNTWDAGWSGTDGWSYIRQVRDYPSLCRRHVHYYFDLFGSFREKNINRAVVKWRWMLNHRTEVGKSSKYNCNCTSLFWLWLKSAEP